MTPACFRRLRLLLAITLLLLGAAGGGYWAGRDLPRPVPPNPERRSGHTGLLNPLLDLRPPPGRMGEVRPFHSKMEALVRQLERDCPNSRIAVYFRDLDNGPWVGVNERQRFFPASLVKLPIVMAALRQAEGDPAFLSRPIPIPERGPGSGPSTAFESLRRGATYTVGELIQETVIRSSNDSAWFLLNALDPRVLKETTDLLGRDDDPSQILDPGYSLSPLDYATYFRVLYNATFLSREGSQRALQLFTRAEYQDGLVAGVPAGTVVAHKFGERPFVLKGARMMALHDCGIVYHPRRPFLLCVMTTGCNLPQQQRAIAAIARLAWDEVESIP